MIKISIIVPCYNVEKYISECLDSILKQKLKEIEIICINDGSTDDTLEIINSYKEKYSNIKIINQSNQGISIARNIGMKYAKGKYIYFVDSDDCLANNNSLSLLYDEAEKNKLDVLFFSFENFSDNEEIRKKYKKHFLGKKRNEVLSEVLTGKEMLNYFINTNQYYVTVWIQLVRKDFLLSNEIKFCDGIIYEDNLYTLELLLAATRVKCIDNILYKKRIRSGSIVTSRQSCDSIRSLLYTIIKMEDIISNNKLNIETENNIIIEISKIENKVYSFYIKLEEQEKKSLQHILSEEEMSKLKKLILKMEQ